MALKQVRSFIEGLEDPKHPLMGPTIKGLQLFGLSRTRNKYQTFAYSCLHLLWILFSLSQVVDLYNVKSNLNTVLDNMSLTLLSVMCVTKCYAYSLREMKWRELTFQISEIELKQLEQRDQATTSIIKNYIRYTRVVTYTYWVLVFATFLLLIVSPFFKYWSKSYTNDVVSGKEPLPQILYSWFPFDNKKSPGYFVGIFVHVAMSCQGSGVLAVFDMNAVACMSYLKGQTLILREKCRRIFECESSSDVVERFRECHDIHNNLVKHHKMFNALLSPPTFLYVLVCSITICGSVVQFTSKEATTSQKLWVVQYTIALVSQLFLYCWHSNDVTTETREVDKGVYASEWWKGDKMQRRLVLLLAGKLNLTLTLNAGPFTVLSIPTFIEIIKGSYSFLTLFSQMEDDK